MVEPRTLSRSCANCLVTGCQLLSQLFPVLLCWNLAFFPSFPSRCPKLQLGFCAFCRCLSVSCEGGFRMTCIQCAMWRLITRTQDHRPRREKEVARFLFVNSHSQGLIMLSQAVIINGCSTAQAETPRASDSWTFRPSCLRLAFCKCSS